MKYQPEVRMTIDLVKNGAIVLIDDERCPDGYTMIAEMGTYGMKRKIILPVNKAEQKELIQKLSRQAVNSLGHFYRDNVLWLNQSKKRKD